MSRGVPPHLGCDHTFATDGLAIAIFYTVGTLAGGVGAATPFGVWTKTGSRPGVSRGYAPGALFMLVADGFEWKPECKTGD